MKSFNVTYVFFNVIAVTDDPIDPKLGVSLDNGLAPNRLQALFQRENVFLRLQHAVYSTVPQNIRVHGQ